jgi:segregation and condensation protein B
MDSEKIRNIVEAALLAAGRPLKIDELIAIFGDHERPGRDVIRAALDSLRDSYEGRGIELKEVASGFRIQVRQEMSDWLSRLWTERPPRYSRALLETLSLIAYRQPITRGDIEDIRGVSVSTNIIRTLMERQWVRVVGHRDVPGRPAMYATTREFLDYFGLKRLDDLPSLAELRDFESFNVELDLADPDAQPAANDDIETTDDAGAVTESSRGPESQTTGVAEAASGNELADERAAEEPVSEVPETAGASGLEEVVDTSGADDSGDPDFSRAGAGLDADAEHAQDLSEFGAGDRGLPTRSASVSTGGSADSPTAAEHVEGEGETPDDEPEEDPGQAEKGAGG